MDWFEQQRVVPLGVGDFDDSVLMEAFARAGAGVCLAPIAIRGEIDHAYIALLLSPVGSIDESCFGISTYRRVSHPGVRAMIEAAASALASP